MYKKALKMLGSIDAELKLVIAGNHDISLDGKYWRTHLYKGVEGDDVEEDDDPEEHSHAHAHHERSTGNRNKGTRNTPSLSPPIHQHCVHFHIWVLNLVVFR
jgi:hypothetical protein